MDYRQPPSLLKWPPILHGLSTDHPYGRIMIQVESMDIPTNPFANLLNKPLDLQIILNCIQGFAWVNWKFDIAFRNTPFTCKIDGGDARDRKSIDLSE